MRVAVVGTGFARQVHLPGYALIDGVELAAVCDSRPGRAEQVAGEFGADRWCENFDDILTMADVDVVDICTPPRLHAPMALAAMSPGKAVICEKPMSSDPRRRDQQLVHRDPAGVFRYATADGRLGVMVH
jgi:predicted dehydrogenase